MTAARYKVFGVYVSEPVFDALEEYLYEEAGVLELEEYFAASTDSISEGDPGADATDALVADLVESFADCYDAAAFDSARSVDPDAFALVQLAAEPTRVSALRERFQAAGTIQETDLRTVQTAILEAYLIEESSIAV
ncbi:hypothetical protein D8Y22_06645 [Salinadaptatus halalkaliphilus]|uniref:Uncharacterized protein n=1 Tax=Salinadaptatus halalkaliphilus TaxID=2419781 RepID=A0A4S3TN55_9EURY|nr:hypothetical protein [Salinadaptatus halalkaliphilus]THE65606.1 hypothetical protein D8Y22_06645 [Salinadaptatus halalkaliphilus]